MITNFELKLKARTALRNNWQTALMVALIASLPSLASQVVAIMTQSSYAHTMSGLMSSMQSGATVADLANLLEEAGITLEGYLPTGLLNLLAAIISPFLTLGMLNYFFKLLRGEADAPISTVFSRRNCFFKAIGLNLMVFLRTFLWMLPGLVLEVLALVAVTALSESLSMLAILLMYAGPVTMLVLGIRAALHYAMADRVMAETPSKGINQCIRESVAIMSQRKLLLFSLEISFFLWQIGLTLLESLLLGMVGNVLASTVSMALNFALNIYIQMAISAFYLYYRSETAI
ncbi:MAG: DUF975 family protein [Clostridia bacterium]|nr:DUF975 family protein [Clostridia bacterium]